MNNVRGSDRGIVLLSLCFGGEYEQSSQETHFVRINNCVADRGDLPGRSVPILCLCGGSAERGHRSQHSGHEQSVGETAWDKTDCDGFKVYRDGRAIARARAVIIETARKKSGTGNPLPCSTFCDFIPQTSRPLSDYRDRASCRGSLLSLFSPLHLPFPP